MTVKVCKHCGKTSEEVKWVTLKGSNMGLICRPCTTARCEAGRVANGYVSANLYTGKSRAVDNGEANRQSCRKHRELDGGAKNVLASLRWSKENPGKANAKTAKRKAAKLQSTPAWSDLSTIQAIYEECPPSYHVDHIIPLQGKSVSGLHVPANLQYLAPHENLSKGSAFDPNTFVGP